MPVDLLVVLIVVLVVVLMWRGPKTLPKLGEALGRGVREAKTEATKAQEEIQARATGEPGGETPAAGATPSAPAGIPEAGSATNPDRPA